MAACPLSSGKKEFFLQILCIHNLRRDIESIHVFKLCTILATRQIDYAWTFMTGMHTTADLHMEISD